MSRAREMVASGAAGTFAGWEFAVRATRERLRLLFAEELVEILKEADEDDDEGAGDADEEEPRHHGHHTAGECDHRGIVNQVTDCRSGSPFWVLWVRRGEI